MGKRKSGNSYVVKTNDSFTADACSNFFPASAVLNTKHMIKENLDCSKKIFDALECLCSKTCSYDSLSSKFKFSSKGLNKELFEDSGSVPWAKYRKVLHETEYVTSTNRRFGTKNIYVSTWQQTKKRLCYFHPKRIVESHGIQFLPLQVWTLYIIYIKVIIQI